MPVKRKSKREKQVEQAVEAAFKKHGNCREFNMFNLSNITDAGVAAAGTEGEFAEAVDAAVKAACDKYEIKSK
jgi:hypothetical protein